MRGFRSPLLRFIRGRWGIPSAVVLLGLSLRIYRIDHQSLWGDEAFSLTVSRLPLGDMTSKLVQDFVHPPLHYYMLHGWFELFGFGAFQARLLSAVLGTLAVVMIYLLARYLFDRRTALLSALLLAVSQLGVMYSQEARPYAQLLFLVLFSSYLFIIALWENRALPWWGFVCSAVLMVYTHYLGILVVASLLLYAILYRKRYTLPGSWLIGGTLLALALYVPWMTSGIVAQALHSPKTLSTRKPPWFAVHWWTFFDTIDRFNNDRVVGLLAPPPWWTFLAGGLLFTAAAFLALKPLVERSEAGLAERVHQDSVMLLAILWVLPVLLALGLGALNVQYNARYVAFCAAPYYILVARGISRLNSPRLRQALVVLILVYSAYGLRANYFIPYKENYRDALAYLAREYREGDCSIFSPLGKVPLQWAIYPGNHPDLRATSLDAVGSGRIRCDRVWLITYRRTEWAAGQVEEAKRTLETTHSKIEERQYFWVHVGLYVPRSSEARLTDDPHGAREAGYGILWAGPAERKGG